MKCRSCGAVVELSLIDLGTAPPSNAYLDGRDLAKPEIWYPLRVLTCTNCWLTQTDDYTDRGELFADNYAYFSSVSSSWLQHARLYVEQMVDRFKLNSQSMVVELASNDGYLLQYVKDKNIPSLGVEPTASTAEACRRKNIAVVQRFFDAELANELLQQGNAADLIIANNVLAHVPDINDFISGVSILLKRGGVATFEFPHLLPLIQQCQFDTIYHEHFSYLALHSVTNIFARHGLRAFDVQALKTHGGSLRVFADRENEEAHPVSPRVKAMLQSELDAGLTTCGFYANFQSRSDRIKRNFLQFLLATAAANATIGAYGAAAKGNTFINYAGIRRDLLPWVADRSPGKHGKYLPGSRIPIVPEDYLKEQKPKYVWIVPWNLRGELLQQLAYVRTWGGQFVVAAPELEIL